MSAAFIARRAKSGSLRSFCTVVTKHPLRRLDDFSQVNQLSKAHLNRHFVVGHRHHCPIDLSRLQGAQAQRMAAKQGSQSNVVLGVKRYFFSSRRVPTSVNSPTPETARVLPLRSSTRRISGRTTREKSGLTVNVMMMRRGRPRSHWPAPRMQALSNSRDPQPSKSEGETWPHHNQFCFQSLCAEEPIALGCHQTEVGDSPIGMPMRIDLSGVPS